ncbi:MAG: dicarboxylate/amino acid:cation symporter [archaeon]|jgi:Na+/H+-dicarboxylate symporter|nr:dicarboxylate/amino acid:cation symporter [archaeon]
MLRKSVNNNSKKPKDNVELITIKSFKHKTKQLKSLLKNKLWLQVIIALIFGIAFGIILGPTIGIFSAQTANTISDWVAIPGNIFLSVIQMVVIPLIFASIILGIASSKNIKQLKKIGVTITIYFIITTTIAIIIGIFITNLINPGQYINKDVLVISDQGSSQDVSVDLVDNSKNTVPNLITNIFPTNVFSSIIKGEMLPIVIFTIIFGIALINIKPKQSEPLLEVLSSLQDVCITIVKWAMVLAPIAVFGLITKVTSQFGIDTLSGLGAYMLTVILGLLILVIVYLLIVYFIVKENPFRFLSNIRDVQLLAFSTSSSAVVMPISIKTAEEKLKVRPSIAQFIIPLGTTINMDGTALYQAVATIFLAQVYGVNIGLTALLFLIVTIVGASIGTPGTPGVGIVILAVILTSVGIPLLGIALIIGVDRILDMCRTAVNVTGDLTASLFINKVIK